MLLEAVSRHLYLRIWLAVVAGVAVLMLVVGWAWRVSVEHNSPPMPRDWVIMTPDGQVLGTSAPRRGPGMPLKFEFTLPDGRPMQLLIQRQWEDGRPPPHLRREPPWWVAPPYGFFWMLGLIGLAVALGLYPVVRRLTQRLEGLQRGVQRWGDGDLSARVPVQGDDEVADLSQRFNAAAARIEGLMASQKSLLANASHELRSPLARIRMGLELLEVAAADAAIRQRTQGEILRNMAELDQLIDEILLASRLDAREADLGTIESVDLVGLCAEECARVGAVLEVPEGMHTLEVQGVGKLLRRMVRNLLENARRYGDALGAADAMTLSLGRGASGVQLRVCDRGPGVPSQWRERIFEPFFRLSGASERVGGVGLGLSLVKSIAERHGATVRCEDRDGGGACFSVDFVLAFPA
jgi:two-component system, OmpR family, sensor kinase